jgi:quercetin dioxygenase-like cupin family protein
MALQGKLRHIQRYITTHDEKTGKAIVSDAIDPAGPFELLPDGIAAFAQCYTTEGFPVDLNNSADIAAYQKYMTKPPGITIGNGTVLRYVDMAPGATSPMHRTVSLDYGVVLEGEVALVLDSGEERLLKRGDLVIQRATMHAWRNTSETGWARMLYILQPAKPLVVGGKEMGEDYGGIVGVRSST